MPAAFRLTLALLAFIMTMASGIADDGWRHRSNYPSRLRVIQYAHPIDAANCALWGAWKVCFSGKAPVANYNGRTGGGGGMCDNIKIAGLLCHNSVAGQKTCSISIPAGCDADDEEQRKIGRIVYQTGCYLYPDGSDPFSITCPQNLVFER